MAQLLRNTAKARNARAVQFRPANARVTQDLGTGFRRLVFPPVTIPGHSIRQIAMHAGTGRVAISGGWSVNLLVSAYATDSYPQSEESWVLYIDNPNSSSIIVTPYLISKSRTLTITRKNS